VSYQSDTVLKHVQREASQGGYEAASERFYEAAAQYLGCQHDEIALIENATRASDIAFYAVAFLPTDHILSATPPPSGRTHRRLGQMGLCPAFTPTGTQTPRRAASSGLPPVGRS